MKARIDVALRRIQIYKRNGGPELDLSDLALREIPLAVKDLVKLRSLNISWNQLTELPDWLGNITKLQAVNMRGNPLGTLPTWLTRLTQIHTLNVSNTRLTVLPKNLQNLTRLQHLDISRNEIEIIPKWVEAFTDLKFLDASYNQIHFIPETLWRLTKLELLNLAGNQISILPEWIDFLVELRHLYIHNNNLTSLPYTLINLPRLQSLQVHNNSLHIPSELLDNKDSKPLLDYLYATSLDRTIPLTEVKVLVLGEAGTGKTAVIQRLVDNKFDPIREPTPGIAIQDWQIPVDKRDMTLHLWDFGGQEIMHNTHQFFLTNRSLYLLVLDATQNEESNGVVKWLKTIHLYAPDAPVIVVLNKSDKFRLRLNQKELQTIHSIMAFVETSYKTGEGIATLCSAIQLTLSTMPHLNDPIPFRWMEVKRKVLESKRDYLAYQEFRAVCEGEQVGETSDSIAQVLHWLGVLLTYQQDRALRHTHILNPNWVTEGIYPILTDRELNQKGGFVTDHDVARILPPERYPPDKHSFILGMMFTFELAFEIERGRYLVPDLLPKESVAFAWNIEQSLRFVYHYDFLPPGIFSRFVVQMQNEVNPDRVWRTGVILHHRGEPYARVIVNREEHLIELSILPPQGEPRTYLEILRDKFDALHRRLEGLQVEERVPIPHTTAMIPYEALLDLEQQGMDLYYLALVGWLNVSNLLDGIADPHARRQREAKRRGQEEALGERKRNPPPEISKDPRKRLVQILTGALGSNPHMKENLLDSAGLLAPYEGRFDFTLNGEDFSWDVIRTLEKIGTPPQAEHPVIIALLLELEERRSGHPSELAFLEQMKRHYQQRSS